MSRVGRHTLQSSVTGDSSYGDIVLDDGDVTHFIQAEVEIEVSGAEKDRPHSYALIEALEDAVDETLEEFDGARNGRVHDSEVDPGEL